VQEKENSDRDNGGSLVIKSKAMHSNGCTSGFIVMGNCGGLGCVVMFLRD